MIRRTKTESCLLRTSPSRRAMLLTSSLAFASGFTRLHPRTNAADDYPDDVDLALQRAAKSLMTRQAEDGAIADKKSRVALTSLAMMALASIGHVPGDPSPFGEAMRRGIDFVLHDRHQDDRGYFGGADNSRMYGHGIITLMLTELIGMAVGPGQNEVMRTKLEQSLRLILASQDVSKPKKARGGWRYHPDSKDSDLSVSVWQVMALRSAKNDEMEVPAEAIDKAVAYLLNSTTKHHSKDGNWGFSYTPGGGNPTFAMTAAGLLAMQVCGRYTDPSIEAASAWLLAHPPKRNERYLFYGLYYYAQGMYQVGGEAADESQRITSELLLKTQRRDGLWSGINGEERNQGLIYATSLAILALSVRYHYLPIYQR
ncbi:MAG: prenyltransferase/squalene oxidase repeat-containing protein [Planctomycetota bacterium]